MEFTRLNVTAVALSVKLPVVKPLFRLSMGVELPKQSIVDEVTVNVPPVLVIEDPAAITNAVEVAVKTPFTLLFNGDGSPPNLTVDPALVIIVPVFFTEPPGSISNNDEDILIVPVLITGDGFPAAVRPPSIFTIPALVNAAPADTIKFFVNVMVSPTPIITPHELLIVALKPNIADLMPENVNVPPVTSRVLFTISGSIKVSVTELFTVSDFIVAAKLSVGAKAVPPPIVTSSPPLGARPILQFKPLPQFLFDAPVQVSVAA